MSYTFTDDDARAFETFLVSTKPEDVTDAVVAYIYAKGLNSTGADDDVTAAAKFDATIEIAAAVSKGIEAGTITPRADRGADVHAPDTAPLAVPDDVAEGYAEAFDGAVEDEAFVLAGSDDTGEDDATYTDDDLAKENSEVAHLIRD